MEEEINDCSLDINTKSVIAHQYLFDAIYDNNFELLKELLNEDIVDEAKNANGYTLLHAAVSVNRLDIIQYLLSTYTISVNDRCNEGRTPFFLACEAETIDFNILKTLIQHGADINAANKEGITPLHCSCRNGNNVLTKFLIGNNVHVTKNKINGYSVLHYIALSNCLTSFKLMMNYENYNLENDLNFVDFDGSTALMLAVDVANLEIAKELLKNGANCNIIGRETSAIHLAVIIQEPDIFQLLWEKTDFNTLIKLSACNNLVKLMIKFGWFFPDRLETLFLVLDHPRILEILGYETKILTAFFYRIRFVKNMQDINTVNIIKKFLKIGVQVSQNDLRVFILNFYRFQNRFEILDVIIKSGTNIDEKEIIKFVIELYPKLIPKFLSFCVKNGPKDVIIYFTEILRINKDMIKLIILMLYLGTPDFVLKRSLIDHLTNFCYAIINVGEGNEELLILYEYIMLCLKHQKIPTLRELSRDVYREYLSKFCVNSNDYLEIIGRLELPKDIINIIQCTIPVNILMDL